MVLLEQSREFVPVAEAEPSNGSIVEVYNKSFVIELLLEPGVSGEGARKGLSHQGYSLVNILPEGAVPNRRTVSAIAQMAPADVFALRVFEPGQLALVDDNLILESTELRQDPPTIFIDGKVVLPKTAVRREKRCPDLLEERIQRQGSQNVVITRSDAGWKTRSRHFRKGVDGIVSSRPPANGSR
jgi:hypothetical protein